jgi:hypothetical protein
MPAAVGVAVFLRIAYLKWAGYRCARRMRAISASATRATKTLTIYKEKTSQFIFEMQYLPSMTLRRSTGTSFLVDKKLKFFHYPGLQCGSLVCKFRR